MTSRAVDVAGIIVAAFAYGYAAGRARPLRRLYDRLDDANDRALRRWRKGNRVWTVAAGYIALHPFRFAASAWRVRRDARAERRAEREAANRWQNGPARKPTSTELAELRERVEGRVREQVEADLLGDLDNWKPTGLRQP